MKPKPENLKFFYLYRDEGNYKDFGELIFSNPSGSSPEAASERLRAQLIDGEYFYPKEWGVPLICGEAWLENWYEFVDFSVTEEAATDKRTIVDFINTHFYNHQQTE